MMRIALFGSGFLPDAKLVHLVRGSGFLPDAKLALAARIRIALNLFHYA
jgi:hypothetical protein